VQKIIDVVNFSFRRNLIVGLVFSLVTFVSVAFLKDMFVSHPFYLVFASLLFLASGLTFGKSLIPRIRVYFDRYWIAILVAIIGTLVVVSITRYFVLAYLLLIHATSCILLKALKRNHIGIELITFLTVLSGVAYGAKVGAFVGASAMIVDYVFSGRLSYFSIVTIPAYALIGIFASMPSGIGIVTLGISMAVFYNLFTSIIIVGFMGGDVDKCLRFGITAAVFNLIVFSSFAGTLLSIMARG